MNIDTTTATATDIEVEINSPKIIIYTNEEKNKEIVNLLCKAIAKSIYESKFKHKLVESCI